MDVTIAVAAIGIFLILLACLCLAAWIEGHGKPPATIDWEGADEL
jgi:hypothetical protein